MEWISVKDRLPEDTKAVIVWTPERKNIFTASWRSESGYWIYFGGYGRNVIEQKITHWQPLPAPPEVPHVD